MCGYIVIKEKKCISIVNHETQCVTLHYSWNNTSSYFKKP